MSVVFGVHFYEIRHPIIVECRKQSPILWKSSLEVAVTGSVVSACQCRFVRNTPYTNPFQPIVMVTSTHSVELGVSELTILTFKLAKRLNKTRSSMGNIVPVIT